MRNGISNMRLGVGKKEQYFVNNENLEEFMKMPPYNTWLIGFIEMIKFLNLQNIKSMAEVGSWQGESTTIFAYYLPSTKIYSVEPFIQNYDPDLFAAKQSMEIIESNYKERISKFVNIEHLKMTSKQSMEKFENNSLDFVYIDGDHRYEYVKEDIEGWIKKICKGKYIGGHDYGMPGVLKAIKEILGSVDTIYKDSSWIKKI